MFYIPPLLTLNYCFLGRNGLHNLQILAAANNWILTDISLFRVTENIEDIDVTEQLNNIKHKGTIHRLDLPGSNLKKSL